MYDYLCMYGYVCVFVCMPIHVYMTRHDVKLFMDALLCLYLGKYIRMYVWLRVYRFVCI